MWPKCQTDRATAQVSTNTPTMTNPALLMSKLAMKSSPGDHVHIEFNLVKHLLRFTKCLYDQTSEAGWHYVAR